MEAKIKLLAVDDVSLNLEAGKSIGLVGESGCGKSTLGKIACGLLSPDSGEVLLYERKLPKANSKSWAAGKIQMIFQDPGSSLDPRMKIGLSVAEPLLARKETKQNALAKASEMLLAVGLGGLDTRYPHQFSGGQRQRIAVARALITKPDVVICDEPVSALDISVQAQILNLLKDLQAQIQPAYLFISHDLAVIGFMCSRILVMYLGQIVEKASREQIFSHPAHPYTAALLAAMPSGDKAWSKGKGLDILPPPLNGEIPSPLNPPSGCHFHPRCPKAKQICTEQIPPCKEIGSEWSVLCHFPNI